jgi:DNA-binding protein HU-beta
MTLTQIAAAALAKSKVAVKKTTKKSPAIKAPAKKATAKKVTVKKPASAAVKPKTVGSTKKPATKGRKKTTK